MFTLLVNNAIPGANNAWTYWIEHIMKKKETYGVRRAAMVSKKGFMSANTPHFVLSGPEIQSLNEVFNKKNPEKVRIDDRTYVIRQLDGKSFVAFNGSKYLIVCPSKTMHIIVETEGRREKVEELLLFIKGLCSKLSAKNY